MNCKRIRDLMITDYMDQEASQPEQEEVLAHLKTCSGCRAFEQALRERVSGPFRKIEAARPPEIIWQRVKEAIAEEGAAQYSPSLPGRIYEFLRGALLKRKPAFAFSSAFAVIFIAVVLLGRPFYRQWTVNGYLLEQSDFMQSMSSSVNGESENGIGFGTNIESVFF